MGLTGSIIHLLLKTALTSFIIFLLFVGFMQIPTDKMPMLLLVVLAANILGTIIASILLTWYKGY